MDHFVIGFVVFAIYSVAMFLFGKGYGKQCMSSDVWYVVWSTNPDAEFDMIPYKNVTRKEIQESLYYGTYEECDKWCEEKADLVDTKNHCWKEE